MDNLCHTLTGAAFGEAGLKYRTRFGLPALMVAANLPDVDVLAFVTGTPSVALRRGWTHGVLAQALLPVLLTAAFVLLDRWRPPRAADASRVRIGAMLVLCYAGVLSHVAMDWLNTYGVRLLMPFAGRWFYGDAVFIIDPWLWVTLAAGVVIARRLRSRAAAMTAIVVATVYIVLMTASARAARQKVADAWTMAKGHQPAAWMVGPIPVSPLEKTVIIDAGEYYERGTFRWWPISVRFDPVHVPKNDRHPAAARAAAIDPDFRAFLTWARFPYYEITEVEGGAQVTLADMRFGRRVFRVRTFVASQ